MITYRLKRLEIFEKWYVGLITLSELNRLLNELDEEVDKLGFLNIRAESNSTITLNNRGEDR